MSDPGANRDGEDVVSSVRRLVDKGSKSGAPEDDEPQAAPAAVRGARQIGPLVLTPAQRIDAAAPGSAGEGTTAAAADADTSRQAPVTPAALHEPRRSAFDAAGVAADRDGGGPGDDGEARVDDADTPALDWRDAGDGDDPGAEDGHARDGAGAKLAGERPAAAVALYRDTDAAADADNVLAVADGAVIDEEALRDLVAEIVREELRGEMGERVTRNVRKLVRREIRRALNAQDFD